MFPKRKNYVFVRCFWRKKIAKDNISTQAFFYNVWQKMANRNLFCEWKINKNENPKKRGFNNRERKQRVSFVTTKRRCFFPIFQRRFLHWKKTLEKWHKETLFRKDVTKKKKVKERRRWWRWDDIDRDQHPSRSSHNTILTEHAIWLFTKFSEGLNQVFFFKWWEKANASRQEHWPPYRCIAFCRSSTVSEHSKLGEFVFPTHTAMHWICGTTTGSCTSLSSTIGKLNNSISQTSVLSRPWLSFGFFSCSFLHPCFSINPTLHHRLFCNITRHLLSVNLFPHQNIARVHPRRPSHLADSFLKFFAQALLDMSSSNVW